MMRIWKSKRLVGWLSKRKKKNGKKKKRKNKRGYGAYKWLSRHAALKRKRIVK